jgi:hypothetical protein
MSDVTSEMAALLLRQAGLSHELFRPDEVAADLTARLTLNDTLDALLNGTPPVDPTAFDPGWHA